MSFTEYFIRETVFVIQGFNTALIRNTYNGILILIRQWPIIMYSPERIPVNINIHYTNNNTGIIRNTSNEILILNSILYSTEMLPMKHQYQLYRSSISYSSEIFEMKYQYCLCRGAICYVSEILLIKYKYWLFI